MSQVPVWYGGGAEVVLTGAMEVVFELVESGRAELPVDALFELEALEALEEALGEAMELLEPEPDEVLVEPLHGFA